MGTPPSHTSHSNIQYDKPYWGSHFCLGASTVASYSYIIASYKVTIITLSKKVYWKLDEVYVSHRFCG